MKKAAQVALGNLLQQQNHTNVADAVINQFMEQAKAAGAAAALGGGDL